MEANNTKIEDSGVSLAKSLGTLQKETVDTVVYKLVRVDDNGRLVPATEDEVMAVEDMLVDDKCEPQFVADTEQTLDSCKSDECLLERNPLQDAPESENPGVGAEKSNVPVCPVSDLEKIEAPRTVTDLSNIDQPVRTEVCSNSRDALNENAPSTSAAGTSWKPDFSKLEGEIDLDHLTVKELHETFKAAFGRETSVKDKQWLKRRITMGLTNACDFSYTTFVIRDNLVVKKGKEQTFQHVEGRISADIEVGVANLDYGGSSSDHDNKINDDPNLAGTDLPSSALESCNVTEDLDMEQRTAKRVRKPTRRYIEELTDVECRESSEKLVSSDKISGYRFACPETLKRITENVKSDTRPVVTRQDSLGGYGVQVPYVSRVRRSRPRENLVALLNLQPGGMDMSARRSALAVSGPQEDEKLNDDTLVTIASPERNQNPCIAAFEKDTHYSGMKMFELENDEELNDSFEDNSETVPTPKGGMRRKHHRPWTINEVVKLVEGVARYGAGRWSEIKRLAFESCPHRTSVDLKDKWRNLLKASFVQLPAEKGIMNSRKQATIPIPAPILSRVRELADMQGQVEPVLNSSKSIGYSSGSSVHEARSGYL